MPDQQVAAWVDQAAGFLRSSNWVVPGGPPATWDLITQAMSNANLATLLAGTPSISVTPAGSAQYALCTTTAVLNFITAVPSGVQVTIPAPIAAMFAADGVTVDPTNAVVAAYIAAAVGYLCDSNGNAVVAYTTGVKSSRKVEQSG